MATENNTNIPDLDRIIGDAKSVSEKLVGQTASQIKDAGSEFDPSQNEALEKSARIYHTLQDLAAEQQLAGIALSCWPQFQSDYNLAVCSVMGHSVNSGSEAQNSHSSSHMVKSSSLPDELSP